MCLYHVSWESNFGFCCKLDDESAQELASMYLFLLFVPLMIHHMALVSLLKTLICAAMPGVLSVQPDEHFESENKDYEGLSNLLIRLLASYVLFGKRYCMI